MVENENLWRIQIGLGLILVYVFSILHESINRNQRPFCFPLFFVYVWNILYQFMTIAYKTDEATGTRGEISSWLDSGDAFGLDRWEFAQMHVGRYISSVSRYHYLRLLHQLHYFSHHMASIGHVTRIWGLLQRVINFVQAIHTCVLPIWLFFCPKAWNLDWCGYKIKASMIRMQLRKTCAKTQKTGA